MKLDDAAGRVLFEEHPELAATDEARAAWGQGLGAGQRKSIADFMHYLSRYPADTKLTVESLREYLREYESQINFKSL